MASDWLDPLESLVRNRAGFTLAGLSERRIEHRLAALARREGYENAAALARAAVKRADERLAYHVVEALAPADTRFFNGHEAFEAFNGVVLPSLVEGHETGRLRIWSAGCGTGQEAWSLAMAIDQARESIGFRRTELIATDFSETALARAQAGRYSRFEVQLGLPVRRLVEYFEQDGEDWRVGADLRRAVEFHPVNLLGDLKPLGQFDCIVCRGVLGHMPAATREALLPRLADRLKPGGWLILGGDEGPAGVETYLRPHAPIPGLYRTPHPARAAA